LFVQEIANSRVNVKAYNLIMVRINKFFLQIYLFRINLNKVFNFF
jgi:hypothetical protein